MKVVKIYRFRDNIGSFRAVKDPVTDRYFELLHWRFEVAGAATATLSSAAAAETASSRVVMTESTKIFPAFPAKCVIR